MSSDPTGIIYYGFPLPDFEPEDLDYYEASEAWEFMHKPKQPADRGDYKTPEWDEWREKFQVWKNSPENIRIEWSGGEGCEAYYVSAEGLSLSVDWSEQIPLSDKRFDRNEEADEQISKFCKHNGIEYREPGWYLAVRYF